MDNTNNLLSPRDEKAKKHAIVSYALYASSFLLGFTFFAGVIWAYLKRSDAKGTKFEDHYNNLIKTFWVTLGLSIIGSLTLVVFIGFIFLAIAFFYLLWKTVRGISRVTSDKPYCNPA